MGALPDGWEEVPTPDGPYFWHTESARENDFGKVSWHTESGAAEDHADG